MAPLEAQAAERLDAADIREELSRAIFPATRTARGDSRRGFAPRPISRKAVQKLMDGEVRPSNLNSNVTVHSLGVIVLTAAREQGGGIVDLA